MRGGPQGDRRVYSEGSSSNNSPLFNIGTERSGSTGQVDIFIRFSGGGGPSHVISDGVAVDSTTLEWVYDRSEDLSWAGPLQYELGDDITSFAITIAAGNLAWPTN